ncbi:hypothetical protein BFC18_10300 [Alteromonas confluentis]|uniref:Uncharacterized protein n=1 Tax=Alteromonas confluentis TaxID=1656094 RepID=A0A1E7ZBF0_9ALTE|nr:hypothetical protein BFC18_10300 [Alteromonas confluentis]
MLKSDSVGCASPVYYYSDQRPIYRRHFSEHASLLQLADEVTNHTFFNANHYKHLVNIEFTHYPKCPSVANNFFVILTIKLRKKLSELGV